MGDWLYWIWFQQLFQRGGRRVEEILVHYAHPREIYHATLQQRKQSGVFKPAELDKIESSRIEEAKEVVRACEKAGCRIITPDQAEYPQRLRNIFSIPCVLYVLGELGEIDDRLAIGMVGTRRYTEYGKAAAEKIARELAERQVVVVSGLAIGIDTVCHIGALKGGGSTIGVIGCGVDVDYPASNRELRQLMIKNGAIISEYPPGTPPLAHHFPVRNRIISGITNGTVVIEGAKASGSLITAGHALSQGKDVFALPGSIFSPMSDGPHWLIRQGATPVTCGDDILEEYQFCGPKQIQMGRRAAVMPEQLILLEENNALGAARLPVLGKETSAADEENASVMVKIGAEPEQKASKRPAPDYLNKNQLLIYDLMSNDQMSSDALQEKLGLPIQEVLSALTQLEIYGLIEAHPGHRFSLTAD